MHVLRCIYQLKIWTNSHLCHIPEMDPTEYGWTNQNGTWETVHTEKPPIPDNVRGLLTIFCADRKCDNNKCVCLKEGVKCCLDCKCSSSNCNNQLMQKSEQQIDDEENLEI
ncbi:uncharacterized protein LOC116175815 [Photinus pyralis]|uniref:uncharacterized protein LOC116175815 n=1 Tax=Photinus pyralis TaxID=7054 RepID=UPI0012672858|nr:uncharacterized protein LOC116175815 [Photinus pyralis]